MDLTSDHLAGASRQTVLGLRPGKRGGVKALPKRRIQLAINQRWSCHWCAQACREDIGWMNSATVEHVLPRSQGGGNDPWNLVMACHRCNTARHDLCWESFESTARRFTPDRRTVAEAQVANKRRARQRRRQRQRQFAVRDRINIWLMNAWEWVRMIPA